MARKPLCTVTDYEGVEWHVFQTRDTEHVFPLMLGDRADVKREKHFGRTGVIPTPELVAYMERHRKKPSIGFRSER